MQIHYPLIIDQGSKLLIKFDGPRVFGSPLRPDFTIYSGYPLISYSGYVRPTVMFEMVNLDSL